MNFEKNKSPVCGEASTMNFANAENTARRRKKQLSFEEVRDAARPFIEQILERWLPHGKRQRNEYVALNPTRSDRNLGSFTINIYTGEWCDFATSDKGGDIISLAAYLQGISQKEALYLVANMLGVRHD